MSLLPELKGGLDDQQFAALVAESHAWLDRIDLLRSDLANASVLVPKMVAEIKNEALGRIDALTKEVAAVRARLDALSVSIQLPAKHDS